MLKKYTALLVALILIVSCSAAYGAEFNDPAEYISSDEFRFVKAFDLMPVCSYDDFQPDKSLTRAEFARILCAIAGLNPTMGGNEFVDIAGNEYEGYICAANNAGLMVGVDKYTFLADNEITLEQALKTIVSLLGYRVQAELKGGYPVGYYTVAQDLDLTDGLTGAGNAPATRGDITRIIYNARNVELLETVSMGKSITYDTSEDRTFLSVYLGVKHVKGVVTDNGITGLRGETEGTSKRIKINDVAYAVSDLSEVRTYIGRYVEAYHTINGSGAETIVYIHPDKELAEDEEAFDISDFSKIDGRTVVYFSGNGTKKINLSATANIIYNGKAAKALTADMFDYDYGTVTYIPKTPDGSDTLIIEGFITWYIDSVDRELEIARATKASEPIDGKYQLSVPADQIGKTIFIEDEYGISGDFAEITRFSVIDICKNDDVMYIRVAPLEASDGQITAMSKSDSGTYLTFADGRSARVSPYYASTEDFETVKMSNVYYIYTNSFGDVAALVLSDNASLSVGYLIGVAMDGGLSSKGKIKILSTANQIEVLTVEDEIKWSDTANNTSKEEFANIAGELSSYTGPINYSVNGDGNVSLIYLPVAMGNDREMGRLGHIYSGDPGYKDSTMRNFGTDLACDVNVNAFATYGSETVDEDRYRYGNAHTVGFGDVTVIDAYNYEPISLYADFITFTKEGSTDSIVDVGQTCVMIKSTGKKVIYNDEECIELEGYNLGRFENVSYYVTEEEMTGIKDTMGYRDDYILQKGDIILLTAKASDATRVEAMRLLWRSDMDNPIDAVNGRKGGIAGGLGYNDSTQPGRSNPYIAYNSGGSAIINNQVKNIVWNGYVYYVDNKGSLVVSTKDLSFGTIEDGWDDSKHYKIAVTPNGGRYAFVSYKDDEIICREGTLSDVRSYLVDGNDCSRVISLMNYAKADRVIIINGEME